MRAVTVVLFVVLALAGCSDGGRTSRGRPATAGPARGGAGSSPPGGAATPGGTMTPLPGAGGGLPPETAAPAAGTHRVTLAIGGSTRRTSLTYTVPGGPRRREVVRPPWKTTFTVRDGQDVDMVARSDAGGSLTCSLKVDGEELKSAMSSGDSMTIDCGDTIGG